VSLVPDVRIEALNSAPERPGGAFVLYWMTASHRAGWSFGLDRAVERAREYGRPLVVLESLRCDYRWASDRIHRFFLDGMAENARRFARRPVLYYPYVERRAGAGDGLVEALGERACAVVTDDFPCFFLPRMLREAAGRLPVKMEQVDSNGLLPLRALGPVFPTASAFRRALQQALPSHWNDRPKTDPLARAALPPATLPAEIARRWPPAGPEWLDGGAEALASLPIDHSVPPVPYRGGSREAETALRRFVEERLDEYGERRRAILPGTTSGLSPYLHFGHISAHRIFEAIASRAGWSKPERPPRATGRRTGWWGLGAGADAFMDQFVVWRELGFNLTSKRDDYDRYESLPVWARRTLDLHAADPRAHRYGLAEFEAAATHDPIWNAAQRELLRDGRIQNYLRMLWGKKIIEWSASPEAALEIMIELNNKYGVDGRDPNSYSGIFWTLGRYDRPWGPERPVFGTVRTMSSRNTARKFSLRDYLERYGP
jgi:deoxyribodipyrimidine photo-lyase